MKGNTPLAKTTVNKIYNNLYRAIIPFDDGTGLEVLLVKEGNAIKPVGSASKFIYGSVSEDIQSRIKELVENM